MKLPKKIDTPLELNPITPTPMVTMELTVDTLNQLIDYLAERKTTPQPDHVGKANEMVTPLFKEMMIWKLSSYVAGSDSWVLEFPNREQAEQAREALLKLSK